MASNRPVKSAQQANANWKAAMQSPQASQKYQQGVQAVQTSPNQTAASPAAVQKYMNRTAEAVSSGKLAAANNAVPLQRWQQAAIAGAARLASGAANGSQNQLNAAQRMQGAWQAARDAAAAIPDDGTTASALAKVAAAMNVMKGAAGKQGGM